MIMNQRIPKRIIQTGKNTDLPLIAKASVVNIKLLNSDFEYLFFDDKRVEAFIDKEFPEYRTIFYSFRIPIQRYDFFRYLAVYHFGGFYFDLDVFLAFSIEKLLHYRCVFPFEELTMNTFLVREYGMDWEIGNYAFGAAAGHPFLLAIIENCVRAQKDPKWVEPMLRPIPHLFRDDYLVLNSTGPGLVSRTLAEYPRSAEEVKVLFPEDVHDSKCWHRFGEFGVHLQDGAWRKRKGVLRRRLGWLWESWIRKKLLKESPRYGRNKSLRFYENESELSRVGFGSHSVQS